MSKPIIVFVSAFLLKILVSCDDCGPFNIPDLKVDSFQLTDYRILRINPGNEFYYDIEPNNSKSVFYDSLLIHFQPMLVDEETLSEETLSNNSFGFSTSFACSPAPPEYLDKISEIVITSNSDMSEDYPANSSLNDLFGVSHSYFIDNLLFDGYFATRPIDDYGYYFRMNSAPTESRKHIFTIQITLEDGRVLSSSLDEIEIIP